MASNSVWSGWIEWNGGECPLPDGTMHQARYRNGDGAKNDIPESLYWGKDGDDSDIIAYRYRLDDNTMTPEEEEAWQDKERNLYEEIKEGFDYIKNNRTAENFLHEAANLLTERGKQYDQPDGERSMGKTIAAFNAITWRDLTEAEGWLIQTIMKRVRQYSRPVYHKDSAEDAVAYSALEAEALESAK